MNIGVLRISLRIPENSSLKGKRQIIKSIMSRVQNRFNVSVAEVGDNEVWQLATIGVSCVSNDGRFNNQVLSEVVDFVDHGRFDVEMLDYSIETITV